MKIVEECFEEYILVGQNLLQDKRAIQLLTGLIKAHFNYKKEVDSFITDTILPILKNSKLDSVKKMGEVYNELVNFEGRTKTKGNYTDSELCLKEFKLNVLYPRLDINVSKHINHLLKSPFCIHPKTGLVSVPLSEDDILNFAIEKIPKLTEIIQNFRDGK